MLSEVLDGKRRISVANREGLEWQWVKRLGEPPVAGSRKGAVGRVCIHGRCWLWLSHIVCREMPISA